MNRKAILSVLAVFLLGAVIGGLSTYAVVEKVHGDTNQPRASRGQRYVDNLRTSVGLTPAQEEQVRAILSSTKSQFDATYDTIRPQMDVIRQQGRQSIRAILSPEQVVRFDAYLRQVDEERKKKGR